MSLLFESIKCQDGIAHNLEYHKARMEHSSLDVYGEKIRFEFELIPPDRKLYKARVVYSQRSIEKVEFVPYELKAIRTLRLIDGGSINYSHKFLDREQIQKLYMRRENADDILIIKDSLITDTSYGNICFFDGENWLTPSTPLLSGTCRARLLKEGLIKEAEISPENIKQYKKFCVINAMRDLLSVTEIGDGTFLS